MKLHDLMVKYGSDKSTHGFCDFYESFFRSVREEVKSVLEIGVADGASIRAWLDYFPNALVVGMDAPRGLVSTYGDTNQWPVSVRFVGAYGDQAIRHHLSVIASTYGPFDIVIDDGGHTMEQQQVSLGVLFPHTRMFYVVEDLHTSFMDEIHISDGRSYPTGASDPLNPTTFDLIEDLGVSGEICGPYLNDAENKYIEDHLPEVHIFDRDGDHKHMTSVLEVK